MGCEVIVQELARRGVTYFVISPGSRSTPLTLAAARHPDVRHTIAYDERGAAYHAVGYARATGKPAVLICTSGTAAANYLPAIAEAANDAIPLIAITADRPPELHGIGANQTMNQQELYGEFTRCFINLEPDVSDADARETAITILNASLSPLPGPVHLNCMLREPFTLDTADNDAGNKCPIEPTPQPVDETALQQTLESAQKADRGILIVGHLATDGQRSAAVELAKALSWPVWADIRSGLHHLNRHIQSTCALAQMLSTASTERTTEPDFIIHIGTNLVSKSMLHYLQHGFSGTYIRASGTQRTLDPSGRAALCVAGDLASFCAALGAHSASLNTHGFKVEDEAAHAELATKLVARADGELPLSEPAIGYLLSQHLSNDIGLFIGNSMPVRFCDRFAIAEHQPAHITANRGVSGIDGTIATAAGFCAGRQTSVVCLLGDISFIHDMNSLTQLRTLVTPMILIVVNNGGGGIFHHLPIATQSDVFDTCFVTPHAYRFEDAARQFGIPYSRAETNGEFVTQLKSALLGGTHALIELTVNQQTNMSVYADLEQ